MSRRHAIALFLVTVLCGCEPKSTAGVVAEVAPSPAEVAAPAVDAVMVVREVAEQVSPPVPPPPAQFDEFTTCATKLIIRWEISSERLYTQRWQGVIWPKGPSGPTWAVGYDGGHQTAARIRADWEDHAAVDRLVTTAGVTGSEAGRRVGAGDWQGVITPYAQAVDKFSRISLPAYTAAARRKIGDDVWNALPPKAQCGLVSLGYNRGWSTEGSRRAEMKTIVKVCAPAADVQCIAANVRKMKRLWPDNRGLKDRREDEARTIES